MPSARRPARPARCDGLGLRDALGHQPRHARGRIEPGTARESPVDDRPGPLDRQRGLRDGGSEHDAPGRARPDRGLLLGEGHRAEEGAHLRAASRQKPGAAAYLAFAGQEGEHVARAFLQRLPYEKRHLRFEPLPGGGGRSRQRRSTMKPRPSEVTTGASSIAATGPASSVADVTSICRSGRNACRTSHVSARPRSAFRERSWNSSKTTQPTPASSGSLWIIRVRMPSVTTSIRVAAETSASPRIRKPIVRPTGSPSISAMRAAAARAARRRGSSITIRPAISRQQRQRHPRRLAGTRRRLQHRDTVRGHRRQQIRQHFLDRKGHLRRSTAVPSLVSERISETCTLPSADGRVDEGHRHAAAGRPCPRANSRAGGRSARCRRSSRPLAGAAMPRRGAKPAARRTCRSCRGRRSAGATGCSTA